ncbi:transmembrane amino acid transporter protein [Ostertagia ostertagi]
MFTGGLGLSREGSLASLHSEDDYRDHNMALRYRLYSRLDPGGQQLFLYLEHNDGDFLASDALGITTAGGIDPIMMEFSDVCRYFLGKGGEYLAVVFSVIVLLGGIMVYWVLMSNFLYYTGAVVYESLQPNSTTIPIMENKTFTCDVYCPMEKSALSYLEKGSEEFFEQWSQPSWDFDSLWQLQFLTEFVEKQDELLGCTKKKPLYFLESNILFFLGTVPVYLAIITLPLMNFKSPTFFTKFNVLGTISVFYLLIFTGSKLLECGMNMNFGDPNSIHYAAAFSWRFPALTGTLTLSFFIHNAVLTILRNQKNPENNARDLSIGYLLAALCYVFIGFTFYAGFPVQRTCISDNFLNNFGAGDILSSTARLFLLFQMITVLPLLMFLIRSQLFYAFMGKTWPGLVPVILLNCGIICIAVTVAILYPKVGSILRYVGSLSGLIYVFALPCLVYMRKLHMEGRLTPTKQFIHTTIIAIGVLNFISQFVI